jgi:hypothetical protein
VSIVIVFGVFADNRIMAELVDRINKIIAFRGMRKMDIYHIVPSATFTNWKNGQIPRADTLHELAVFLGTDMSYLWTGKPPGAPRKIADIVENLMFLNRAQIGFIRSTVNKFIKEND